jgi:hypothetical protein
VANECLDCLIRSGEVGELCKLDLEDFDDVNSKFLLYLWKRCAFGELWRDWITTVWFPFSLMNFHLVALVAHMD